MSSNRNLLFVGLLNVVIISSFLQPTLGSEADHDHGEAKELMETVGKSVCGAPNLSKYDQACLESVVKNYFKRFSWCAVTYKNCFLCDETKLGSLAQNLFQMSNTNDSVDLENLEHISVALVVLTHDIKSLCAAPNTVPNKTFSEYFSDLSQESKFKTNRVDWLEHAFEDFGKNFNKTENKKCITHQTIIKESKATTSTANEEWSKKVSLFSVLHVLTGYQLDGVCVTLPSEASIIRSLKRALNMSSTADRIPESVIKKIMTELGIGNGTSATTSGAGSHAGHNHRRKRSTDSLKRVRRATAVLDTNSTTCLSVDNLFAIYNVDETQGATVTDFKNLCPALIEQKLSGACKKPVVKKTRAPNAAAYGFGVLAVAIISCGALLGVVFIPCMKKTSFDQIMAFSIALAVGTLICDSLLHLLPESLGLHDHTHPGGFEAPKPYFWKFFLVVCVIYLLYVLELALTYWAGGASHSHSHSHNAVELTNIGEINPAYSSTNDPKEDIGNNHSYEMKPFTADLEESRKSEIKNSWVTAIYILLGDGIHNFADGMAIGAAFAGSVSGGLSTSVAILCHELPHEIGDLAVLLSTNMSIKKALLLNLISACAAFIGFFIGVPIGGNEIVRQWIFTVTSGIFLYMSLTNMLTSIKNSCPGSKCVSFLVQSGGFLIGIIIILIIGLFESQIKI